MSQATKLINHAQKELQQAETLGDVVAIKNAAAEIKVRAERRAGEMLKEGAERGDRKAVGRPKNSDEGFVTIFPPTLSEIGVTNKQSSRWQSIALIPKEKFEHKIQQLKQAQREVSQNALLKVSQAIKGEMQGPKQEALFELADYRKKIDYHVAAANRHIRQANHYRQQAFEQFHVQLPLPFEFADQAKEGKSND